MELSEFHRMGLLLALLRAELHRAKLVHDLGKTGLVVDSQSTDLLPSICFLLDPERVRLSEWLYERYVQELKRITALPLPEFLSQLPERTKELLAILGMEEERRDSFEPLRTRGAGQNPQF